MKNKYGLRLGDFIVFAIILACAALIWLRYAMMQTDHVYGEIWQNGELVERIVLADNYSDEIVLEGKSYESTIEIDGKRMRFVNSHCSDHTCERTGWLEKVGDTAVCLPNRVLIKIVRADGSSERDDGVDVIVQ